jgi:hypothetical protein
MSHGDDYREFDASDVWRFAEAIDETVADMTASEDALTPA